MATRDSLRSEVEALAHRRVVDWRMAQFALLGFGEQDAQLLAESDGDLETARELVAADCPLGLVMRIVL